MLDSICTACQYGEHANHHEATQTPPPGMLGGSRCTCKGECVDWRYMPPQTASLLAWAKERSA